MSSAFLAGVEITLAAIVIIAIIATGHYVQQVRDILKQIHETQKKLATRLGVTKP